MHMIHHSHFGNHRMTIGDQVSHQGDFLSTQRLITKGEGVKAIK